MLWYALYKIPLLWLSYLQCMRMVPEQLSYLSLLALSLTVAMRYTYFNMMIVCNFSWCLDVTNSTTQNTTAGSFIPAVYENGARTTEIPFPPSLVFDCSYEIHIFQHESYGHLSVVLLVCGWLATITATQLIMFTEFYCFTKTFQPPTSL